MTRVAVIGCGVVGASIAYELSQVSGLSIILLDSQPPAQSATGAALGVLMGVISQKQGNAWKMRHTSLQRYQTLIPELQAKTDRIIPWNQQGIVSLCWEGDDLSRWRTLAEIRQTQGWRLEIWDVAQLQARCPQTANAQITGAIYSPQDCQIDPTALTLALVDAAQRQGVTFYDNSPVQSFKLLPDDRRCLQIFTPTKTLDVDWVVIAAGLGSTLLTQTLPQPVDVRPVLGQALRVRFKQPLGIDNFQPVITSKDIHLVPLADGEYWIGATVEFPLTDGTPTVPDADRLQAVLQGAIEFCPALASAEILHTWSGLRPRPENRPAPIVEPAVGYDNILLATGHYRNGVLLAPDTAQKIRLAIASGLPSRSSCE